MWVLSPEGVLVVVLFNGQKGIRGKLLVSRPDKPWSREAEVIISLKKIQKKKKHTSGRTIRT